MSTQKTRKEIIADLAGARAEIEALNADHASAIEALNIELSEAKVNIEALTEQIEVLKTDLAEASAGLENAIKDRDEHAAQVHLLISDVEAKDKLIERQKIVLSDPSVQDAVHLVPTEIDQAKEDAEADLEEKSEDGKPAEPKSLLEQYRDMPQGAERAAFYQANKKELHKQLESENQEV